MMQQNPEEHEVGTQDEPVMDHDAVPDAEKLHGIVVQTISDLGATHTVAEIESVAIARSTDSGLSVSHSEIREAVGKKLR